MLCTLRSLVCPDSSIHNYPVNVWHVEISNNYYTSGLRRNSFLPFSIDNIILVYFDMWVSAYQCIFVRLFSSSIRTVNSHVIFAYGVFRTKFVGLPMLIIFYLGRLIPTCRLLLFKSNQVSFTPFIP